MSEPEPGLESVIHRSVKLLMQVLVSGASLGFLAYSVTGDHDPNLGHAASGWVGAVVGYWLR